ncbi:MULTISPECIES: MBL fold metallo-hydrolase [Mycobacteriaceae]|uniref:Beta-lactamase n=2 Tax=Mycolicibacterium neoaurum TaxID=1795 RepID=V5X647_MYCNE|nr:MULTISPECIES: MBL fold metallo-hydrolase [Mycobacteriaceae]AFF59683.1 beta-lactamase [Mycolicibacterium neoaurum]AHC23141.1 beta-lactamase [Mycolicibacterium neoaurum VKM Ac-1815D]AMO03904.1 beta-lactamase [Mycolicibacterium neoaurum]KJQ48260.1 beta-lactamase [Mycolicibacterium neoaurum]KUM06444.1 MBL fold metallo-hydrolase [Mycolicibacterium neoaurum]
MSTRLGNAVLSRVVETSFAPGFTMFGGTPEHAWAENADLLAPSFVDLEARTWRVAIQTWVLDVDGLRILIDTGVGNGKRRPAIPVLDGLDTGFLAALESAGVSPESVDIVVNTHLHSDHVGWNTRADGAEWTPTFPNARYLMPEADFRYFGPDGAGCDDAARIVFDDSVAPVYEAGQVELFGGDHQLSESVWLRPAAGHTPGSSVLWLDAGAPAVFVGDLTHCAIQIPRPGDACAFDCDAAQAVATRTRVFTEAARRRATVIPAHYPGHGGATLVARGDAFLVDDWLDIEPI